MSFDVDQFRNQFPILSRQVHGKPLVYLDSAASVQKPRVVIDRLVRVMEEGYANVHRGLHTLSNDATTAFEAARESVRAYLNAPTTDEIIFTGGGTDALNLIANSVGQGLNEGDEIILSVMEHHSNIVPWHFLRERKGVKLKWLDIGDDGAIDLETFAAMLTPRTKLVSITAMSNVLGAEPPIREMAALAREAGALFVTDGCQHAVHGPVDVQALGIDFYIMTGHKTYGPTGVGALFGRKEVLDRLPPYRGGGEMIDIVEQDRVTYAEPPSRFEAGTPPIVQAIGLGCALDWLAGQDIRGLKAHEADVTRYAGDALRQCNFATVYGGTGPRGPVLSFNLDGAHPHDVSTIMDRQGVAVRAGHHCAQPLMKRLGVSATARASFAAYTTKQEIDVFVEACAKAHNMLRA